MHSIFHLMKADFLERVRSFTFLVVLGACMYLTYTFVPDADASYITVTLGNYRGLYNAAWIGTLVAMMSSVCLTLFGFYLVNNSVHRDFDTGVGQIIATTQLTNFQYLLGKTLSNFMVFLSITAVVALMATGMLYLNREEGGFNLWSLYSPFLYITLPTLFFVAAFSAFVETFRKVNKGLINIVYFFLFMSVIGFSQSQKDSSMAGFYDLLGVNLTFDLMGDHLHQQVNDYNNNYSIGYLVKSSSTDFKTFSFDGVKPDLAYLGYRLWWIFLSFTLLAVGAYFFRRFDPTYDAGRKEKRGFKLFRKPGGIVETVPFSRLAKPSFGFSFFNVVKAEGKIMLNGASGWWVLVTVVLFITSLFVKLETAHEKVLLLLWVWQVLIWSKLGSQERQNHTEQVIFSAPNVLTRQLFAGWSASVLWALLLAGGVMVRLVWAGEMESVVAIGVGAMFLPSLALFCGIFTGGEKLFQVLYLIMAYSVIQSVPYFDYMGAVEASKSQGLVPLFAVLTVAFIFLSILGRRRQMYV